VALTSPWPISQTGTLVSIIRNLVSSPCDNQILYGFLLTYRTFSSSLVILRLLLHAFDSRLVWQDAPVGTKASVSKLARDTMKYRRMFRRIFLDQLHKATPKSVQVQLFFCFFLPVLFACLFTVGLLFEQERIVEIVCVWMTRHVGDFGKGSGMLELVTAIHTRIEIGEMKLQSTYSLALSSLQHEENRMKLAVDKPERAPFCNHNKLYLTV